MAATDVSLVSQAYDAVADRYDESYKTPLDLAENYVVKHLLGRHLVGTGEMPPETVLDLGCGTGLGLDLLRGLHSGSYIGIDISARMIERAQERLERDDYAGFIVGDMLHDTEGGEYDAVVSLFGSPNYVSFPQLCRVAYNLLEPGGVAVLMPFCRARYYRSKPVIAHEAVHSPISAARAERDMSSARFEQVRVHAIGGADVDMLAPHLTRETLIEVMLDLAEIPNGHQDLLKPIYVFATGRKSGL